MTARTDEERLSWACEMDPFWYDCIKMPCSICPNGVCEGGCGEVRENCCCPPDDDYDDAEEAQR